MRSIAEHEPVLEQLPLDRLDRAANPRVGRREEADERQQQEARIELLRPVRLREGAELGFEAALADVPVDLVPDVSPAVGGPFEVVLLDRPYRTVERDPGHRLGVDEVAAAAADLPDPVVRLAPRLGEMVEQPQLQLPRVRIEGKPVLARLVEAVEYLAVDVELELVARGVADAHRLRALVTVEPRQLELAEAPLAGDAVHDLDVGRVTRDCTDQPAPPLARLVRVVAVEQREQRQRRVTQPAIAVVPVAHRAYPLR